MIISLSMTAEVTSNARPFSRPGAGVREINDEPTARIDGHAIENRRASGIDGRAVATGRATHRSFPGHDDRLTGGVRPAALRWSTDACAPTNAGICGRAIATGRATPRLLPGHDDRVAGGVRTGNLRWSPDACAPRCAGM